MAKQVKLARGREFNFEQAGKGKAAKYPWDEWFNGDLLMLERHDGPENAKGTIEDDKATTKRDYGVPNNAMVPKIHTAARKRYKVCQISRYDADGKRLKNALIIRARDMNAEERVAEDLLRQEEKAKAKAKKAEGDTDADDTSDESE